MKERENPFSRKRDSPYRNNPFRRNGSPPRQDNPFARGRSPPRESHFWGGRFEPERKKIFSWEKEEYHGKFEHKKIDNPFVSRPRSDEHPRDPFWKDSPVKKNHYSWDNHGWRDSPKERRYDNPFRRPEREEDAFRRLWGSPARDGSRDDSRAAQERMQLCKCGLLP